MLKSNQHFRLGEFSLDVSKKILWRDGEIVPLPLKAVELLCVLVEARGEVVGKETLMEKVWKDSFVDESVLTQNIYLLRKTLRQTGDGKDLIKNVSRRGYIFDGEVSTDGRDLIVERHLFEKVEIEEVNSEFETEGSARAAKNGQLVHHSAASRRLQVAASVISLSLLVAIGAFFYFRGDQPPPRFTSALSDVRIKPLNVDSRLRRLAILPLKSAGENDKAFAAALTKDLAIRLGSLNRFNISQTEAGQARADYVLDGSVQVDRNSFRVDARLLDAATGGDIWSERFTYGNVIQLQDAVANGVSRIIQERLTPDERESISKKLPTNLGAYEMFQSGYQLWRKRADGKAYFQKAIELDQNFARAYVGLASQKMMGGTKDSLPVREAEELLEKAFEIDEDLADIFAARGFMLIFHRQDWTEAERSLRHAINLDPNSVNAHHWLAVYLSIHRRLDEATQEMQIALELDPTNPTLLADMGQLHYFSGEKDLAVEYCSKALEYDPNHHFAGKCIARTKQSESIQDHNAILRELDQTNSFTWLYINVDPKYHTLRDHPTFKTVLRKMNLAN